MSPDVIAVCIQSATKLFGYWASEAAKQWTDGFLNDLKKAVDIMIEQMGQFASSTHIEVQERVSDVCYFRPRALADLIDFCRLQTSFSC